MSNYVDTGKIKAAVKGREGDVLDALGIEWRATGPIECPYSDHVGDSPAWHWDGKKRRATCSCIGSRRGDGKSHDIFKVVSLTRGGNFPAAKLWVAEVIGRTDLIQAAGSGEQAIRDADTDAEVWEPEDGDEDSELAQVRTTYPLPALDRLTLDYRRTRAGVIKVHRVTSYTDPETGEKRRRYTPVATPFGVPARLRYADRADAYGIRVTVQDMSGKPRALDFDRAALAKNGGAEIRAEMLAAGLRPEEDGETIAVQCLKAAAPTEEIIVMRRPGWQEIAGHAAPVFICPDGTVLGTAQGTKLELAASARMPEDVAASGTLDGWTAAIDAALSAADTPHWTLSIAAGFVGPVISLTGLDTSGINLSGLSSSGKSTGQKLAVSAWSTPDVRRPGLSQSARATANAVEALAYRATGTVLSLDELAHVPGKTVGEMIYTIAGGVGKSRMTAEATMRQSYAWSTFAVMSGECSLEEKIRSDGGDWMPGMAVRIADVDVTDINRSVDAATMSKIAQVEHHFGHAGPAFVRALIAKGVHLQATALRQRVLDTAKALAGGDGVDSAITRAAQPFALLYVAGTMAKDLGILPGTAQIKSAVRWAWARFQASSDNTLDPEAKAITNLRNWIAGRWDVSIKDVYGEHVRGGPVAVGWYDTATIYILKEHILEATGRALKEAQIGKTLDRRGLIAKKDHSRYYTRFVPVIGHATVYALPRDQFGRTAPAPRQYGTQYEDEPAWA